MMKTLPEKINRVLYEPSLKKVDKKILTIVVDRKKDDRFDFLRAKTEWFAKGEWRGAKKLYTDNNIIFEVEFKDDRYGRTSKKLMKLLDNYNRKKIKEEKLYARVTDIERSSL